MKKFGFGKKSDGDDDDRNRAGLFGRKKPTSQDDNPYAQQPAEDPYARMTPYQQARANLAAGPQAPGPGAAGLPSGPRPGPGGLPSGPAQRTGYGTPPPSYQGNTAVGGGYAQEKFGAAGGYGSSRYDTAPSPYGSAGATSTLPSQRFPSRGPGGYGGLGPADDEDPNRNELLAGARERHAAPPSYVSTDNNVAGASSATNGYGGYGAQREFTAEELEKEEYSNIKNQIRDVRNQTVNSSTNAAMQMENSINVGRGILVRLGQQGEMLHNAEKNMNLALNQSQIADDKTGELKTLNRSMFLPHVSNPFTSKSRQALREQKILDQHRMEAEERDATRRAAYADMQGMEQTFRELERPTLLGQTSRSAAERSKYMMDEDSDEEGAAEANRQEDQIEANLRAMENGLPKLKTIATAMGSVVDGQNVDIERIGGKSQKVDQRLALTRAKLNRIH